MFRSLRSICTSSPYTRTFVFRCFTTGRVSKTFHPFRGFPPVFAIEMLVIYFFVECPIHVFLRIFTFPSWLVISGPASSLIYSACKLQSCTIPFKCFPFLVRSPRLQPPYATRPPNYSLAFLVKKNTPFILHTFCFSYIFPKNYAI